MNETSTIPPQNNFRENCFNLIRLLVALQVAYGHMVEYLEIDILSMITNIFWFFMGVPIFLHSVGI